MGGVRIDRYLLEEEAAAELLAARVRLGIVVALIVLESVALLLGVVDVRSGLLSIGLAIGAVIYALGVLLILRRGYRRATSYLSITFDTALVTANAVGSGIVTYDLVAATKAPRILILFLVIATAGLRQAPGLPIFAGVMAIAAYLGIFAAAALAEPHRLTSCIVCDFNGPGLNPFRIASVAGILLLAAALTSITASRARQLVRRAVQASVRRQTLLTAMARYFPEQKAIQMIESGSDSTLPGRRQEVTVLTTDIRGFTTLAERLDSGQVVALLNHYFEEMVRIIFEEEGALISFVGDAIWAVFGLQGQRPDDTDRALAAAQAMRRRLETLNRDGMFESVGGLRIGMAIHAGEVVAGNVGSSQRQEYTVIGDTVNSSARLEELNKTLGTDLLVSEVAAARLTSRAGLIDRGEVLLRGRAHTIRVFAVETSA